MIRTKGILALSAALLAGSAALLGNGMAAAPGDPALAPAPAPLPPRDDAASRCAGIARIGLPDTRIQTAELISNGIFQTPVTPIGAAPVLRGEILAVNNRIEGLPRFCRIVGTTEAEIGFELWLPVDNWNGSYHGVGVGGMAGRILYAGSHGSLPGLSQAVKRGYAVSATDSGHKVEELEQDLKGGRWSIGRPDRVENYFTGGIHKTAVVSKLIVTAFYGRKPEVSTFAGCSNGGRQALVEATRFPEDYDAIVAFAPTDLQLAWGFLMRATLAAHKTPASVLSTDDIDMTWSAIVKGCDAKDGLADGEISDPRLCSFRPAQLLCKPGQTKGCLTQAQVTGLEPYYQPVFNPRGGTAFTGTGETSFAAQAPGNGPSKRIYGDRVTLPWQTGFGQLFSQDVDWDPNVSFNPQLVEKVAASFSRRASWTTDFDAFRNRGGKLLIVQGWSDWGITPETTIAFYEKMMAKEFGGGSRGRLSSFSRFYLAPGTDHCAAGERGYEFDALSAVEKWRRTGVAPETILATRPANAPAHAGRMRPLCPFPQRAVYKGKGSIDDAGNFVCKA